MVSGWTPVFQGPRVCKSTFHLSVILSHNPKNQEGKREDRTKSVSRILREICRVSPRGKPYIEGYGKTFVGPRTFNSVDLSS